MKNKLNLSIIGCVLLAAIIGCSSAKQTNAPASGQTATENGAAPKTAAPVAVKASELTKAYDENELAADGKYKGKVLEVSGKITNIAETLGNLTVSLAGHNIAKTVMCGFDESEKPSIAKLKNGQSVTLTGTGDGSTGGLYVGLNDCKIK